MINMVNVGDSFQYKINNQTLEKKFYCCQFIKKIRD